jgi:galactitol PTS system EIIB component
LEEIMAETKRILVSCGTAIATSTVVARGIEEAMKERGINVTTRQCKASEIRSLVQEGFDLIVTTTPVPDNLGVPVIHTLAFLTGIGKEEVIEQIYQTLSE